MLKKCQAISVASFTKPNCDKNKYFSQPSLLSNFWGRISGVTIDLIELYSGIKKFYRPKFMPLSKGLAKVTLITPQHISHMIWWKNCTSKTKLVTIMMKSWKFFRERDKCGNFKLKTLTILWNEIISPVGAPTSLAQLLLWLSRVQITRWDAGLGNSWLMDAALWQTKFRINFPSLCEISHLFEEMFRKSFSLRANM